MTLIGDALHPMSPFKGQGANQAMVDALDLARSLYKLWKGKAGVGSTDRSAKVSTDGSTDKSTETSTDGSTDGSREVLVADLSVELGAFEVEMLSRASVKVKASAEAALFLHSQAACAQGNVTRANAARAFFAERQANADPVDVDASVVLDVDVGATAGVADSGRGKAGVEKIDAADPDAHVRFLRCMRDNTPALVRGVTKVSGSGWGRYCQASVDFQCLLVSQACVRSSVPEC